MVNKMPNIIENELCISGSFLEVLLFREAIRGKSAIYKKQKSELEMYQRMFGENYLEKLEFENKKENILTFHSFVPVPDDVLKHGYQLKGYDWQIENWGTKWDAIEPKLISEKPGEIIYHFETAWSEPEPWLDKVIKKYPRLKINNRVLSRY